MRMKLDEVTRAQILNKNRTQSKDRYAKRLEYKPTKFDTVDILKLFEDDYFVFKNEVKDKYIATLAFHGVFSELKNVIRNKEDFKRINLQLVIKALSKAFDKADDVLVDCTCPDFRYRFKYHASQNGFNYGDPETRPSDIRNPNDNLGATCKHLSGMLSSKRWMRKAASYINNWIKRYPEDALDYILPGYEEREIAKVTDKTGEFYNNIYDRQAEESDNSDVEVTAEEAIKDRDNKNSKAILLELDIDEVQDLLSNLNKNSKVYNEISKFVTDKGLIK